MHTSICSWANFCWLARAYSRNPRTTHDAESMINDHAFLSVHRERHVKARPNRGPARNRYSTSPNEHDDDSTASTPASSTISHRLLRNQLKPPRVTHRRRFQGLQEPVDIAFPRWTPAGCWRLQRNFSAASRSWLRMDDDVAAVSKDMVQVVRGLAPICIPDDEEDDEDVNVPEPEDSRTAAVAAILEIIPGAEPEPLLNLIETHLPTYVPIGLSRRTDELQHRCTRIAPIILSHRHVGCSIWSPVRLRSRPTLVLRRFIHP
ncbi:hypothetical protein D9611_011955 [Ephemerocybe angulata]|uniref:Uncharacterized protein n=1 Tax=Ephemerocybe angulata TaxID=980116 RepID=A0A8H5C5R6_9AGAR|nr:hypothetical protein D9611_011955 [Tulosesus angulatus]